MSVATMKTIITNDLSNCFTMVYDGYRWASLSGCERLLTKSQRHIHMFLQLCEWAEGEQKLSSYGIKNPYVNRKSPVDKSSNMKLVQQKFRICSLENFDFAVDCYLNAVENLKQSLLIKNNNKQRLENTNMCLIALKHIKELLCIGEIDCNTNTANENDIVDNNDTVNNADNINNEVVKITGNINTDNQQQSKSQKIVVDKNIFDNKQFNNKLDEP